MSLRTVVVLLLAPLSLCFFSGSGRADQVSHLKEVVRCMKEIACGSPVHHVFVDDKPTGLLLQVSSGPLIKDHIVLTDEWIAVRKTVKDDGDSITLIFASSLDGAIEAVRFSHSKSTMTTLKQSQNMSKEERNQLQAYFDSVITMAYALKVLSPGSGKN